jgi:hypothetical protein
MKTALEAKERDLNQERAEALALADQLGDEIERLRTEKKDLTEKLLSWHRETAPGQKPWCKSEKSA